MNRRLVSPLFLASLLVTGAFAASAQTVATSVAVDTTAQAPAAELNADVSLAAEDKPEIDRYCLQHTGSRIVARPDTARRNTSRSAARANLDKNRPCLSSFGRVYSREDIERTGEIDLADALRKLDPSIH